MEKKTRHPDLAARPSRYGVHASGWATAACLLGFASLALAVGLGGPAAADLDIARRVQFWTSPWLIAFMSGISSLGAGWRPVLLTSLTGLGLIRVGLRLEGVLCMAAVGSAALLGRALKSWLQRPRPGPDSLTLFVDRSDASFPSGHAVFFMVFFGFVCWVLMRCSRSPGARLTALSASAVLTAAGGVSRVFLGAHWPTDVAAGYALGAFWLGLALRYFEWRSWSWPGLAFLAFPGRPPQGR